MEEKNKKKISIFGIILLTLGIIVLAVGVFLLISGINQQAQANAAYEEEYATWHKNWWEYHTATIEDMPKRPGTPVILMLGAVSMVFGIGTAITGVFSLIGKREINKFETNATQTTTTVFGTISDIIKPQNRVCKYCGSENKPDAIKCDFCGAALNKDKKR